MKVFIRFFLARLALCLILIGAEFYPDVTQKDFEKQKINGFGP